MTGSGHRRPGPATLWALAVATLVGASAGEGCGGLAPGEVTTGEAGVAWVYHPGGTFERGGAEVTLSPFFLLRSEVTVAQYRACLAAGGCPTPAVMADPVLASQANLAATDRADHPMNWVRWGEAAAFCAWIGGRLPTEAEWEYAARGGGRDQPYPWGAAPPDCTRAVMAGPRGAGCGRGTTWPVCAKPAGRSPLGVCDLIGNVEEWVADRFAPYPTAPSRDPAGPAVGDERVVRGGSYMSRGPRLSARARRHQPPTQANAMLGFRCARLAR